MTQYGFFFDQSRCVSCYTCATACKDWNDLPPGPLKFLRLFEYEKGTFPDVRVHAVWAPCYHCENPICVDACPNGAIYKEDNYGAVLIDESKCTGTRMCYQACPYGAIVYASDKPGEKAQKCTMCIDKLEQGEKPVCVSACWMRALDFGPFDEIQANYGEVKALEDMPSHQTTWPAVVFRPMPEPLQHVPYNKERALELLARRDPLPPLFDSPEDATEIPDGIRGRDKLVIKPSDSEELMRYTCNDEG